MTTLHDTLNDLEEKAKKATPGPIEARLNPETGAWHLVHTSVPRGLNGGCYSHILYCDKTDAEYIAACSPDTVLALITVLREAREVIEKVAKPIQKTVYRYGSMSDRDDPPYPVTETVDKDDAKEARAFLAKYPKGDA